MINKNKYEYFYELMYYSLKFKEEDRKGLIETWIKEEFDPNINFDLLDKQNELNVINTKKAKDKKALKKLNKEELMSNILNENGQYNYSCKCCKKTVVSRRNLKFVPLCLKCRDLEKIKYNEILTDEEKLIKLNKIKLIDYDKREIYNKTVRDFRKLNPRKESTTTKEEKLKKTLYQREFRKSNPRKEKFLIQDITEEQRILKNIRNKKYRNKNELNNTNNIVVVSE